MHKRGFTLIELIVVFAIISLLSSVIVSSISAAREKARDARRIDDLAQIRTALELYYSANGQYPPASCGYDNCYSFSYTSDWDTLATALAPHITSLPRDPKAGTCPPWYGGACHSYSYGNVTNTGAGHQYDLTALLEGDNHPLRCEVRQYRRFATNELWCGPYTGQIYEASP